MPSPKPVQFFFCGSVLLESICYRTTSNRLRNASNKTGWLKKIGREMTMEKGHSNWANRRGHPDGIYFPECMSRIGLCDAVYRCPTTNLRVPHPISLWADTGVPEPHCEEPESSFKVMTRKYILEFCTNQFKHNSRITQALREISAQETCQSYTPGVGFFQHGTKNYSRVMHKLNQTSSFII